MSFTRKFHSACDYARISDRCIYTEKNIIRSSVRMPVTWHWRQTVAANGLSYSYTIRVCLCANTLWPRSPIAKSFKFDWVGFERQMSPFLYFYRNRQINFKSFDSNTFKWPSNGNRHQMSSFDACFHQIWLFEANLKRLEDGIIQNSLWYQQRVTISTVTYTYI